MPEPLYRRSELVLRHDRRLVVFGPPAGPAGTSILELPDTSVWQVDHVDSSVAVTIEAGAGDPARCPLLVAAFGGDGALFMADRATGVGADPAVEGDYLREHRPRSPRYGPSFRHRRQRQTVEAGRLVVLADAAGDRRLHPLARVAASLEFALSVGLSVAAEVFVPLRPSFLDTAESLSREVDDYELAHLDRETAAGLRSLCQRARKTHPGDPSGIERLADRLGRADHFEDEAAAVSLRRQPLGDVAADEALGVAASRVAAAPPPEPHGEQPEMRRTAEGLVRIVATRSTAPRWTRILHRRGLVLLGQAPLRREGLVDVADVVVPADVPDGDLEVQVLYPDDLSAVARGPADALRAAVSAGREAARSDRLGDPYTARQRWIHCADLWLAAGDEHRSDQAGALAGGGVTGPLSTSSVADTIAETLAPLV